jgi:chemotaxis protein CheD
MLEPAGPKLASRPPVAAPIQPLHLMPGQWHVAMKGLLKTLLGSCVGITLWHPNRGCGGMCHFLLPSRQRRGNEPLDGRYGDEALELMVQAMRKLGTQPQDCMAHLYGGADTLPDGVNTKFNVGERNIEQGMNLIDQYGFQLIGVDVGEHVPRTVTLTLPSGEVTMTRGRSINRLP